MREPFPWLAASITPPARDAPARRDDCRRLARRQVLLKRAVAARDKTVPPTVTAAQPPPFLFGVAVMSGLLYISEIKQRHGMPGVTVEDAVLEGSKAQLRPVLMVIVVAALGMVPAMLAQGIGSDIQRPLATVVVGGLASTLVLTPLGLPAAYLVAERLRRRS